MYKLYDDFFLQHTFGDSPEKNARTLRSLFVDTK